MSYSASLVTILMLKWCFYNHSDGFLNWRVAGLVYNKKPLKSASYYTHFRLPWNFIPLTRFIAFGWAYFFPVSRLLKNLPQDLKVLLNYISKQLNRLSQGLLFAFLHNSRRSIGESFCKYRTTSAKLKNPQNSSFSHCVKISEIWLHHFW